MSEIILLSDKIAEGHCVVLNEFDRPCGRLIAVIISLADEHAYCKYLNADSQLDGFNSGLGIIIKKGHDSHNPDGSAFGLTPISKFGIEVVYDPSTNSYCCEHAGESTATYLSGQPRRWQENVPLAHHARAGVAQLAIPN